MQRRHVCLQRTSSNSARSGVLMDSTWIGSLGLCFLGFDWKRQTGGVMNDGCIWYLLMYGYVFFSGIPPGGIEEITL